MMRSDKLRPVFHNPWFTDLTTCSSHPLDGNVSEALDLKFPFYSFYICAFPNAPAHSCLPVLRKWNVSPSLPSHPLAIIPALLTQPSYWCHLIGRRPKDISMLPWNLDLPWAGWWSWHFCFESHYSPGHPKTTIKTDASFVRLFCCFICLIVLLFETRHF